MRVLVVEDEVSLAELIKEGLEDEGYSVDWLMMVRKVLI